VAYDYYPDSNGVRWTIVFPAKDHGWSMLATVMDDEQPRYDPLPSEDISASMPEPEPMGEVTPPRPTGDQTRVMFSELVEKIEAYAKKHRGSTILTVRASRPMSGWLALGLAVAALVVLDELT
jgi:hypothetical protein